MSLAVIHLGIADACDDMNDVIGLVAALEDCVAASDAINTIQETTVADRQAIYRSEGVAAPWFGPSRSSPLSRAASSFDAH